MHFKAWLTRSLPFADEAIQVVIEDTDDLETFKKRTLEACRLADHRASIQRRKLFEDTDLTDELSYTELTAARAVAEKLYPTESLPKKLDLGKGTAFEFSKNLLSGEVLKLYVHEFTSDDELTDAIQAVWDLIDKRLEYTNKRELKASEYLRTLPISMRSKILAVMDILYGRAFKDTVVENLRKANVDEVITGMREENVTTS